MATGLQGQRLAQLAPDREVVGLIPNATYMRSYMFGVRAIITRCEQRNEAHTKMTAGLNKPK